MVDHQVVEDTAEALLLEDQDIVVVLADTVVDHPEALNEDTDEVVLEADTVVDHQVVEDTAEALLLEDQDIVVVLLVKIAEDIAEVLLLQETIVQRVQKTLHIEIITRVIASHLAEENNKKEAKASFLLLNYFCSSRFLRLTEKLSMENLCA